MTNGLPDVDSIPDYGWSDPAGEESHAYLGPAVLRALQSCAEARHRSLSSLRVFDAGCGNGALLRRLLPLVQECAGCDASDSGTRTARAENPTIRVERLSVYDDLKMSFGGGWDVVVATEVIEHLYAPREFVARARELLVAGGHLILTTPYHGYLKNLALAIFNRLDRHWTALWDGGHIKFWSYRTLTSLLAEQGFDEFTFRGAGRMPGLWKSMVVTARLRCT
jgi:2-polyprenyl-6-hydroxyphenyl methylase/3-demethylubiquinone-9 3-methyltransferase